MATAKLYITKSVRTIVRRASEEFSELLDHVKKKKNVWRKIFIKRRKCILRWIRNRQTIPGNHFPGTTDQFSVRQTAMTAFLFNKEFTDTSNTIYI